MATLSRCLEQVLQDKVLEDANRLEENETLVAMTGLDYVDTGAWHWITLLEKFKRTSLHLI